MFLILLLNVLFASTFTLGKAALTYAKPFLLIGIRMLVAGIALIMYKKSRGAESLLIKREHWGLFLQVIIFHIFFAYIGEFWALQYLSSAKACLLFNLSPFIAALLSYSVWHEKLSKRQWLGLIIGFAAFLPILIEQSPAEDSLVGLFFISLAELALIGSVIAGAYGWVLMKRLVKDAHYSPLLVNGVGMIGGGTLSFLASLAVEGSPSIECPGAFMLYTGALIIIANFVCYNLYGFLLKKYSATFMSFAGSLTPLFAAAGGWFFLQEHISVNFFLTFFLVLCGLYIFYLDELKQIEKV